MNLTGRRVISVIVCWGLVPVVAALVGCGRSQEQAESEAPMPQVAEHEEAAARRQGSDVDARRARERAQDARRAAAMLRAGPQGVGSVLAS